MCFCSNPNAGGLARQSSKKLELFVLVCEVTNRFLSDLEQAITSPSPGSSARLPCCFLERDLDRADAQG